MKRVFHIVEVKSEKIKIQELQLRMQQSQGEEKKMFNGV